MGGLQTPDILTEEHISLVSVNNIVIHNAKEVLLPLHVCNEVFLHRCNIAILLGCIHLLVHNKAMSHHELQHALTQSILA